MTFIITNSTPIIHATMSGAGGSVSRASLSQSFEADLGIHPAKASNCKPSQPSSLRQPLGFQGYGISGEQGLQLITKYWKFTGKDLTVTMKTSCGMRGEQSVAFTFRKNHYCLVSQHGPLIGRPTEVTRTVARRPNRTSSPSR